MTRLFRLAVAAAATAACLLPVASFADPAAKIVVSPLADVRAEPKPSAGTYEYDPLQETQLVYGETALVHRVENGYAWISGVEQMEYTHNARWEGYPGWVALSSLADPPERTGLAMSYAASLWTTLYDPSSGRPVIAVPFASRLPILKRGWIWTDVQGADGRSYRVRSCDARERRPAVSREGRTRARIWRNAKKFIGTKYYWGGLTPTRAADGAVTGVDCSGLVNACYRLAGIDLPRDSHEQWMRAARVEPGKLKRGDLVFLAKPEKPDRVVHVMIYAGGEYLIEGPGTGMNVRRITFKRKLGRRLSELANGATAGERIVYFGSYFSR